MKEFFNNTCKASKKTSLYLMIVLTLIFFIVELFVGQFLKALSLVADSFHMFSDVLSLIIGLAALKIAHNNSTLLISINTFGWARAEVLGALINSVFLISQCFRIIIDSIDRFISPHLMERPLIVLYVGISGLLINILGLFIFHGHAHVHSHSTSHAHMHHHTDEKPNLDDNEFKELKSPDSKKNEYRVINQNVTSSSHLNMKGVYLHILGDAIGSIIVIISALVTHLVKDGRIAYFDPCASLLFTAILLKSSIPLLRESSMILLQRVPTHIQIKELQNKLLSNFQSVVSVHEFHVWQLAGDRIIASVHLIFTNKIDYHNICEQLKKFFHDEGIHSTTIQPEFIEELANAEENYKTNCLLPCVQDSCKYRSCCLKNHSFVSETQTTVLPT